MGAALLATLMAVLPPATAGRSDPQSSSPRFSVSVVVLDPSGAVVSGAKVQSGTTPADVTCQS